MACSARIYYGILKAKKSLPKYEHMIMEDDGVVAALTMCHPKYNVKRNKYGSVHAGGERAGGIKSFVPRDFALFEL